MTRVLLNLISNGFYAVTKRKAELGEADYDPMLSAATKGLGDTSRSGFATTAPASRPR